MPTTLLKDRLDIAMRDASVIAADLARACGIKPASVSDWITGKTKTIKGANLLAAARLLGVTPEWLSTGRGPRTAPGRDSQLVRLDPSMIAITHRVLRDLYKSDLGDDTFCIEDDVSAARFVQVYALRAGLSARPSPEEWVEYGRKLEVIMKPQGALDGRGDGVPTEGTGKKNVAGNVRRPKA